MLAVKVLQEQDIDLIGISFVTPFFGPGPGLEAGRKTGIELLSIDISDVHLEMLKNPRYGYGSNMNPCIDCHGLMLREAGKVMEREGADFLFTGEVLGQRPMSQRRDSMRSVEKLSGYLGRVLRPLSAKLLPLTIVEEEGLVDRGRLLDIQGRSRKPQAVLAKKYGITDYPQPGGGCMLTKQGFANRLRQLFRLHPDAAVQDVEIIKRGRAFTLPGGTICMVGRQESDNIELASHARDRDILLRSFSHLGPTCLMLAPPPERTDLEIAAGLVASYSDAPENAEVEIQWTHGTESGVLKTVAKNSKDFREWLI